MFVRCTVGVRLALSSSATRAASSASAAQLAVMRFAKWRVDAAAPPPPSASTAATSSSAAALHKVYTFSSEAQCARFMLQAQDLALRAHAAGDGGFAMSRGPPPSGGAAAVTVRIDAAAGAPLGEAQLAIASSLDDIDSFLTLKGWG